jgi:phosphoglycolate phosphatase
MKKPQMHSSLIFDLDGTLIDSAPTILDCFKRVLKGANLKPRIPIDNSLIGPPLRQTLMNLTGLPAGDTLEKLAINFQSIYDTEGYKSSRIYPGVEDILSKCNSLEIPMAIATNKRRTPTLKILEHLGWGRYFQIVETLDTPSPSHADKAALIAYLLNELGADAKASLYVGDKWEDGEAAAANGMSFAAVDWGYGKWDRSLMKPEWRLITSPYEFMTEFE